MCLTVVITVSNMLSFCKLNQVYYCYYFFMANVHYLACSANLPTGLYILLSVISSFYIFMSKAISVSTGPIFTIFHQMEGICVNFLDLVQFFRFLKGRCHSNQFCAKITYPLGLIALSFRNGMGYRYRNVRVNSVNDASISCENFVKFSPVTLQLTELICERQVWHGQKTGAFAVNEYTYLNSFGTKASPVIIYMSFSMH